MTGGGIEHATIESDAPGNAVVAVELERRPGRDALLAEQFREAPCIAGDVECLPGQDASRLMVAVPVARGAAEHRYDHVRPEPADHPHHILEQRVARPEPECLVRCLGEPEIERAGEVLFAAVDASCGNQL